MPDVEATHLLRDAETKSGVALLSLTEGGAADGTGRREEIVEEGRRGQERNPVVFQLPGDGGKKGFGIPLFDATEHF